MDHAHADIADQELVAVAQAIVRVVGRRRFVDGDGHAVIEGKAAVAGNVIRVRVRLERSHDPHTEALGLRKQRLDRVGRIDDEGLARALVAEEVRRAAEIIVQELAEDHDGDASREAR
jgi:hypothetical protein